jgi:2'-hydroxyisoflavone reductase
MSTSRRTFLKTSALAAGALGLGALPDHANAILGEGTGSAPADARRSPRASKPLRILILGGTGFIGPFQVRYAVSRGHHVTVFTRGRRQADLPKEVEHLTGDRNGQLDALKGKKWDVVIDNSATRPAWVKESATLLKDAADRYMYVSSTGVFLPYLTRPIDETVQPRLVDDPATGKQETYGVMKALSEREAQAAFGDRAVIVRPHFIVGPGDYTDRFPYWPVRLARGGEVLAPGRKTDPVQLIDVRDLTEWMVHMLEQGHTGVYNAAGPRSALSMEEFLYGAHAAIGSEVTWTWIEDYDWLAAHDVQGIVPWIMLRGDHYGMTSISSERAIAKGLTYRPLATTVKDTLDYWQTVPEERRNNPKFALTPAQEAELLAAWKARPKTN